MRATRAYIAGIGTSGVLLAFAALLLIVLGALLGFRGWPGGGTAQEIDRLVIDEPDRALSVVRVPASGRAGGPPPAGSPRAVRSESGRAEPAEQVAPLSSGSGAPLTGSTGGSGGDRVGGDRDGGGPIRPSRRVPISPAPVPPPPVAPPPPSRPPVIPQGGLSPLTDGLGGTTKGLTQNLGLQLQPVSPPLGGVVQDGGTVVGGVLIDLGNGVDDLLAPIVPPGLLSPPAQGAVPPR